MKLIRRTKNGVNHVVRGDKDRTTVCGLRVREMDGGDRRLCVDCKRGLTAAERKELWR